MRRITRSGGGSSSSAKAANRDPGLAMATHAYGEALHVGEKWGRRIDMLVSAPRAPRPPAVIDMSRTAPASNSSRVVHEVGKPYRTSFKLGFGFTAGAWTFRAIVQASVGAALLILILRLLSFVIG